MPTIELHIKGKVQGVFYRASTKEKAAAMGLVGWVKNLPDGSVLVKATGTDAQLESLQQWCRLGPPNAKVSEVLKNEVPEESFRDFSIVR